MLGLPARIRFLATAAVLAMVGSSAYATSISGTANIMGTLTLQGNDIIFSSTFTRQSGATETGAFTGLSGGTIQNLTGQTTGALTVPIGGFANLTGGVAAPVIFDLTSIDPGVGSVAACSSATPAALCTLAGSPLTFLQLTTNAVMFTLVLEGVSYTGMASSGTGSTRFVFSSATPITGTIPGIAAQLVNGGSITGLTYSASAAVVAPEPAALLMIALGLVILLAVNQRAQLPLYGDRSGECSDSTNGLEA